MNLHGKTTLVTGGAHRVGRDIATALARRGSNIVIHYGRSAQKAEATAGDLQDLGVETLTYGADLSVPAEIAGLFRAVENRFGRLDVLVNSAATFTKESFDRVTQKSWDDVMAVNLRAPFLCSQHARPLITASHRKDTGLIVNIIDLAGVYAWQGYIQHGVSKAGLRHLTQITARELAPQIRVNALILGPILPPPGMDPASDEWQKIEAETPLQRSARAEEVGQAVVTLAENDFITGAEIFIDGGQHLLGPAGH